MWFLLAFQGSSFGSRGEVSLEFSPSFSDSLKYTVGCFSLTILSFFFILRSIETFRREACFLLILNLYHSDYSSYHSSYLNKSCEGFIASWHPVGPLELSGIKLQPGESEDDLRFL